MEILYKLPSWFANYDSFIQIFFAVVCFLVTLYSYRLYKISKHRSIKLFSISFLLIGISYIAWPVIGFFTTYPLNKSTLGVLVENSELAGLISVYVHVLFFIVGLVTLVYMTLKKEDLRLYLLLLSLTVFPIIIAIEKTNLIYILSAILIFFVLVHYYNLYSETKNKKIFTFFLAFLILFFASLDFIFSDNNNIYYVGGHFLMLISYLLILVRLAINYRKWQKKEIS